MTILVADIGGTYIRLALYEAGAPQSPVKYEVTRFKTLEDALLHHQSKPCTLLIATAARREADHVWRFHNNNEWEINEDALRRAGWDLRFIVNDFKATARGAVDLSYDYLIPVQGGIVQPDCPAVVLGPGTGLGLAYVMPPLSGARYVQETFGGHMLALAATREQGELLELLGRLKGNGLPVIPEDIVSGRALPSLYQAVCEMRGLKTNVAAQDILDHPDDEGVAHTLRLFHECLGLFVHQAVLTGHGFGGVYLDGGIIHRLYERRLFNGPAMLKYMTLDLAPVVKAALKTVPVWIINEPFTTLRGLGKLYEDSYERTPYN